MKTYSAKAGQVKSDWYVVDAAGKVLGRLATEIASRLRGKHKPEFTPSMDTGDHIVVVNAAQVRLTGRKLTDKVYHQHTGYIGNMRHTSVQKMLETHPERVIEIAVKGMLPKGPLGYAQFGKLKVYAGAEHPHQAQQPKTLNI